MLGSTCQKMGTTPTPRPKRTQRLDLGPADDAVLSLFYRYHYLTAQQVCRLRYRTGSLTYVQTKLKKMTDLGYLQRLFLPRPTQCGSGPSVYTLARKGINRLDELGIDVDLRFRPSEQREHSYLFLLHSLALSDLLISFELLCRDVPHITLHEMLHERLLKPVKVKFVDQEGQSREVWVCPDARIVLRIKESFVMPIVLEVDRATEEQSKIRRKIRALLQYAKTLKTQTVANLSLTILFVAPTEKRLKDLLHWTEQELKLLEDKNLADLFRFASFSPSLSSEQLFLAPRWYRPFDRQGASLFEEVG
jgi:hypothetical protein